jgi:hypothetical protein
MNWAVTLVNHGQRPAYFEQLAATVEEIGRLRWLQRQVITLADDAATLSARELRDRPDGAGRQAQVGAASLSPHRSGPRRRHVAPLMTRPAVG